ncbi:extracellular solute-binding protein family 1 [Oscillochloris trichoides DG-6]|uniref:Extracellular solute-binding protein family 1 n=1 Tax=Oscillochloris trichoides DG-6 TaxID=765420 RepID=E1IA80_9CHLR|nr:extracellular solute-binding protein [Oscillochloris trichoides]EFO81834.1 extracellular solute-binding protein family 1 [Oscillochloris trichoides DG-6]
MTGFLLCCLVACQSLPPESIPPATTSPPVPARTLLILWHAWPAPQDRVLAKLVEGYNRSQSSVQIIIQSRSVASISSDLALAVSEGGGPHLALLKSHTLGTLVEQGALLPLDDTFSATELGQLLPTALATGQVQTATTLQLYGIPITFDTLALYYNQANFAATPPADLPTLLRVARGLTDTQSDPPTWGLALNLSLDRTIGYLYAFEGRIFDTDNNLVLGTSGRAGAEAWLAWVESLHSDPQILASSDGIAVENAIMRREVIMTVDWSYALSTYHDLWQEHLGVAMLPQLHEGAPAVQPYVQTDLIVLNARSSSTEHQAMRDFIRYLLSSEAQRSLLHAGCQPTNMLLDLNQQPDLSPYLRESANIFRRQAAQGQPMPNRRETNEIVWNALDEMQANTLRHLLSPAQAVSATEDLLRQRLNLVP